MSLAGKCSVDGCNEVEDWFTIRQHQYILDTHQGQHVVCAEHADEIEEHPERFFVMMQERRIRRTVMS